MRYLTSGFSLILFVLFSLACRQDPKMQNKEVAPNDSLLAGLGDSSIISSQILTREQQKLLSPDLVIEGLIKGNSEFINDRLTIRNNTQRIQAATSGQYPEAVVLSCLDSRVPVEDIFHKGIGDLFVARVAGNIVNIDILGSLEYACKVSGSKLIVVLGHEYCGAIKSAIDGVKLGNITALLAKIAPSVQRMKDSLKTSPSSKDERFVDLVCRENVVQMVQNIRSMSPILKEMEQQGEIKIVGAIYDMKSGKVSFF